MRWLHSVCWWVGCSCFLLFFGKSLSAQEAAAGAPKAVRPDSSSYVYVLQIPEEKIRHKADRSLYLSLLLPGLGQVYNGDLWKVPIIYAGLLSIGSYLSFYDGLYQNARIAEYRERNPYLSAQNPFFLSGRALSNHKNSMRRSRDLLTILGVAAYALQALEAHVSAYLDNFSVRDAKVWMLPGVEQVPQNVYGVHIFIKLRT